MDDQYQFEELKSGSAPEFEEFYSIYAESIAARERKSKVWITEMTGKAEYKILLLKHKGHVIGFSVLFLPQSESFGLLEYMATTNSYRNQGLGAGMFRRSVQASNPRPLLLEVDSDREECMDRKLRRRRQQFYRRLGCLTLSGLRYIMPLAGEGPPPDMDLMIYPTDNLRHVAKSSLESWLKVIYRNVYHCSPEDLRIQQMLSIVTDPIELV